MSFKTLAATLALPALALAACTPEAEVADEDDLAAEQEEAEVESEALSAGNFDELQLGAKIVGPQGDEVITTLRNETGAFADIRSYVACPADMDVCDPSTAPAGTVYTYVHVVYPGEDNDADTGSGAGVDASDVETAEAFRMTRPSHGFTGDSGFSHGEAGAALGAIGAILISCHEDGLSWTVEEGDGGDQWDRGEPITFYWQSTLPPAGPANAYEIFANYTAAGGDGPYPAEDASATNARAAPSATTTSTERSTAG